MPGLTLPSIYVLRLTWAVALFVSLAACTERKVDFSSEVKPILNKRCISCHGGVKRNAKFSLLFRKDALDTTESGKPSIIPGDAAHSEMIKRITSEDPEYRMPYKEERLTEEEINTLKKWIDQGAEWGDHWAYVPPVRPTVNVHDTLKNEVDVFISSQLERNGLSFSEKADKSTLLRRVYLDITGLPPTEEEAKEFLNDSSTDAYEKVVDRLLASPHYGEKWTAWWLDLARYADTKGYERDVGRNIWRYRDWVIRAFNDDKPFDEFTLEQLAGDMLPHPTDEQLVATAFHRNTMNNDEGGTEDEEFRVAALIDRVNTTWEVWQSTTMACVQCHTHPYDPFLHEDYYRSMAFFNNTRDEDTEGEHPNLRTYSTEDQVKLERVRQWIVANAPDREQQLIRFLKTTEPKIHPHDFDRFVNGELVDTKWLGIRPGGSARLKSINMQDKDRLIINYSGDAGGEMQIHLDDVNGAVVGQYKFRKTKGWEAVSIPLQPSTGVHDLYFTFEKPGASPNSAVSMIEWFAFREEHTLKQIAGYDDIDRLSLELLNAKADKTPVLIENTSEQHRQTHIFERGNWLVKGDAVQPGVPEHLNKWSDELPLNRLGFSKWLFEKDNPLTSRTIVNRIWEQIFGTGIVETLEDFGTQGATPSHPELLDWLALELSENMKWRLKPLIKKIVMSHTYQQQSKVTPLHLEKDPTNRLLARAPRIRLSAEQVRDQALAASGLLSSKMFGPSVMPYQPDRVWSSVWSGEYWKKSKGEDELRRSVYTYIKRTSPYPAMMMFDGSSREVCISRRIRTNTPLQSLVTLNDSTYLAASRNLAKVMSTAGRTPEEQIAYGYKRLLFRDITAKKLNVLTGLYRESLTHYAQNVKNTPQIDPENKIPRELAALTVVANTMFNLDEVLTKE